MLTSTERGDFSDLSASSRKLLHLLHGVHEVAVLPLEVPHIVRAYHDQQAMDRLLSFFGVATGEELVKFYAKTAGGRQIHITIAGDVNGEFTTDILEDGQLLATRLTQLKLFGFKPSWMLVSIANWSDVDSTTALVNISDPSSLYIATKATIADRQSIAEQLVA